MSENTSRRPEVNAVPSVGVGINTVSDIKDALNLLDELKNRDTYVQGNLFAGKSTKVGSFFNYDEKKVLLYSIFETMIQDAANRFVPNSVFIGQTELEPVTEVKDDTGKVIRDGLKEHQITKANETPNLSAGDITTTAKKEETKTIMLPRAKEAKQIADQKATKEANQSFDGEHLANSIKTINDLVVTIYDGLDKGTADDKAVIRKVALALLTKVENGKPYLKGNESITTFEEAQSWYNSLVEARVKANEKALKLTGLNGEETSELTKMVSEGDIEGAKAYVRYLCKNAGVDANLANPVLDKIIEEHTPTVTEDDKTFQFSDSDKELIKKTLLNKEVNDKGEAQGGVKKALQTARYCAKKVNFDNTIVIRRRVMDLIKEIKPKAKTSATKVDINHIKSEIERLTKKGDKQAAENYAKTALEAAGWAAKNISGYLSHVFAKLVKPKDVDTTSETEIAEKVAISQIESMSEDQLKSHTIKLLKENLLNEAHSDVNLYARKAGWDEKDAQKFIEDCKNAIFTEKTPKASIINKKEEKVDKKQTVNLEEIKKRLTNPKTSQTKMKRALGELLQADPDKEKAFNIVWKYYEKKSDWNEKKVRDWINQISSNVKTA